MTLADRLRKAFRGSNLVAPLFVLSAATVSVSAAHAQTPAATLSVLTPKPSEKLGTNRFNLDVRFKSLTSSPVVTAELWVDGVRWVRRDLDSPRRASVLSFLVDGSTLPAGAHTIVVKVLNAEGDMSSAKVEVIAGSDEATGENAYGGPDVRFVTPGNGKKVVGTVELLVDAQTRNGANPYVSFYVDDKFKTLKNYPPYSFVWDTTNESNGVHTVTASGYLDSTNTTTTRKITVFVNNPGGFTKRASSIPDLSAPRKTVAATVAKPLTIPLPTRTETVAAPMGEATIAESTAPAPLASATGLGLAAPATSVAPASAMVPRSAVPAAPVFTATKQVVSTIAKRMPEAVLAAAPANNNEPTFAETDTTVASQVATFATLDAVQIAAPRPVAGTPRLTRPTAPAKHVSIAAPVAPAAPLVIPTPARVSIATPKIAPVKSPVRRVMVSPKSLQVAFDGQKIAFDVAPRIETGMPIAPFRQIFEHTGGKVSWSSNTKTMRGVNADREIVIGIGKSSALVNGAKVSIGRAATLERGRTVVPLNFVGKALDVDVKYDAATGRLSITSKN